MNEIMELSEGIASKTPLISDKFAIDLVNSIEVQDDLIKFKPNNSKIHKRIFNQFTGRNFRHQEAFNSSVADSIKSISDGITVLQKCQIESDQAITLVSQKLIETRQGVMRLQQGVKSIAADLINLEEMLTYTRDNFQTQVNQLNTRVSYLESKAMIDIKVEGIRSGKWSEYAMPVQLALVLSELNYGALGCFLKSEMSTTREQHELVGYLESKLRESLVEPEQRVAFLKLTDNSQNHSLLPELEQQQLTYLLSPYGDNRRVLGFLHDTFSSSSEQELGLLPTRMSQKRLASAVTHEIFGEYCA